MKYGEEMKVQFEFTIGRQPGCFAPVKVTSPQFPDLDGDGSGGNETPYDLGRCMGIAVADLMRKAAHRYDELKRARAVVDLKASAENQFQLMTAVFEK
jgi:hypothetical protein